MEIKVYNNVFDNEYKTFEYDTSKPLLEQLEEHIEKETYRETLVECYDPETGETFYAPMLDEEIENPSVMIVVDGKSVDKDYQPKEGELVSVIFLPASKQFGTIAAGTIIGAGVGITLAGLLLMPFAGGMFASAAMAMAPQLFGLLGLSGAVIGGLAGLAYYNSHNSTNGTIDNGKQGNQSPDVRGAENSSIRGENFSFVIGKHLVAPRIIGDPITEYSGPRGEDAYIKTLYQVGYAPLKLTEFKLGEFMLAYNRDHKIGDGTTVECGTYVSGHLKGFSRGNVPDSGDILDYWKNNDVELEIIQQPNQGGQEITIDDEYQNNTVIDLANRPRVPAATMHAAGWTDVPEGDYCTIHSIGYSNEEGTLTVLLTPINPDGTVLTPSQLDVVAEDCLVPSEPVVATVKFNVSYNPAPYQDPYVVSQMKLSLNAVISSSVELQVNSNNAWVSVLTLPSGAISSQLSDNPRWAGNTCRIKIGSWTSSSFVVSGSGTETINTPEIYQAPEHPENLLATFTGSDSIEKSNAYAIGLHENQEAFYNDEHYDDGVNYGSIYTSTYDDQQINANLFYIADKELDDNAKVVYKGSEFPNKFRTNGVFFTAACPMEFTITLDFQNGLYDTYTKTEDNTTTTHYDAIPLYLCVQWRVYSSTNKSSDPTGGDYDDWNTINIGTMKTLDATAAAADKAKHKGNDFGNKTLEEIYGGFYGKQVSDFSSYAGEDGLSEIRISKTVTLTKAQCEAVLADTNKGRFIEVRVLRVSPNYMNMVSDDGLPEGESAHSYSDHVKVISILTKVFDEDKLKKEDTLTDIKPLSDEDYKKFCLVAIKAKADASGYISQQLKSLSCIAESFSPIWDSTEHKVLPENITTVTKYFGYYKNGERVNRSSDDDVTEQEVTKAQYEEARRDGFNWYAQDCGTNYASVMKNIIFTSSFTHNGGPAYKLTETAAKYNNNTAASGFLLGCFGPQNGPIGIGSDGVNLAAIGEWAEKTLALKDGSTFDADTEYNGVQYHDGDEIPVRMEANAYIYAATKLEDLLQKLAFCGRAAWFVDENGKISVLMDGPVDYTKGVINAQNCISSSNAFSYEEPPAGLYISFSDENDGFQTNQFYCWSDGNSPTSYHGQVEPYSIEFVTNPYQIWSLGRYLLALREMNREVLTRKIGVEGATYNIGNVVLLQSEDLLIGDCSGRIQEVIEDEDYIYGFVCNSPYEYNAEQGEGTGCSTQGVTIMQPRYYGKSNAVTLPISMPRTQSVGDKSYTLAKGTTNVVLFKKGVPKDDNDPSPTQDAKYNFKTGDICMFGLRDYISAPYRITKIKPEKDGTFTQTLIPYNEGLYNAGAQIPSFQSFMPPPVVEEAPVPLSEVPTTLKEQNDVNENDRKRMDAIEARIAQVYSNHIVTLYKKSETDLPSSGIGTTLVYDFSTDTITWGDPSLSNGWSLDAPSDLTDVWVTSATAHGQSQTDTINSNEWARPIKVGQNGVNGLNTCTISLYKRLGSTPQDLPAALTYNFSNASMVCSNWNGWSASIPPIDEEDNDPCWEIHATALSTQTTDTIQPSEWSECVKILSEGLSKQEVLDLIGERINETPNVLFTPSEGMFAVDEDGIVSTPQTAFMDVRVIQNDEDITFSFGQIDLPTGMTVSATVLEQGTRLNFTVAQGTRLERTVIKVPVIFTAYADNDVLVDENGNPLVWVEDEDGRWYGDCSSVSSLPIAVSGGFIYWNGIDTTASEEVVEGGVFYEGIFYTYNGTKWKESKVKPIGIQTEATSSTTYDVYYTASIVKGGRYDGGIPTVASIPSNPVIGDYFTWTGADQTPYEGSGFTKLASGCVYKWNGTAWEKDTSGKHLGTALPDILEVAESELVENNSDVVEKVGKMIAWDVVTQNIKVTGEALINSAIIADLTLGDSNHTTSGEIKSYNYSSGSAGFRIKADGTAEFNNITARGNITASSLTVALDTSIKGYADTVAGEAQSTAISTASADATSKANTAQANAISTASADATSKANSAQAQAISTASSDASSKRNDIAVKLGYSSYEDMVAKASSSDYGTIIENGRIRTTLIETEDLFAQNIIVNTGGSLESEDYTQGSAGWKIKDDGTAEFNNVTARGSLITGSLKVERTAGYTYVKMKEYVNYDTSAQIWGMIVTFWQCLGGTYKNIPSHWLDDTDVTFALTETQRLLVRSERRPYNHYVSKVKMSYASPTWGSNRNFVKVTLWDENNNSFDYLSLDYDTRPDLNWRSSDIGDLVMQFSLKIENNAYLKYTNLPESAPMQSGSTIKDCMYNDNGLLKLGSVWQPWHYRRYKVGTDLRTIWEDFYGSPTSTRPYFSGNLYVGCIGYYGSSDSSHSRCINGIRKRNGNVLEFVNINETVYVSISGNIKFGEQNLDKELAVLFLSQGIDGSIDS